MFIRLFAFIIAGFCAYNTGFAQQYEKIVTLALKDAPLSVVKTEFEKRGYRFWAEIQDKGQRFNCNLKNESAQKALDKLFPSCCYDCKLFDNVIYLKDKNPDRISISGKITNENNINLRGVNITIKGTPAFAESDEKGEFCFDNVSKNATLVFTSVFTEQKEEQLNGRTRLNIRLQTRVSPLRNVFVAANINIGLQNINPKIATGVYQQANLLSGKNNISLNADNELQNIPGALLKHGNQVWIRGNSTILADRQPLVVLNDFIYEGDLNRIALEEIESITILKDAVATSIYGIRASNGAIVIKTRSGKFNQPLQFELSSKLAFTRKPDLFKNADFINSPNAIDVQQYLFDKGFYNDALNNPRAPVPPAVIFMHMKSSQIISDAEAKWKLDSLKMQDVRHDLSKHFYQNDITQQQSLNISGGDKHHAFQATMLFYNSSTNRVRNGDQHASLSLKDMYTCFNNRLQASTWLRVNIGRIKNNNPFDPAGIFSYSKLVDEQGNPLAIERDYRDTYTDTAGSGRLQNWKNKPVEELALADNKTDFIEFLANGGVSYKFNKLLTANILYQYEQKAYTFEDYKSLETYYTRNLINRFTQVDGTRLSYGIPIGGISDKGIGSYRAHNLAVRVEYLKKFKDKLNREHILNIFSGTDTRQIKTETRTVRLYGYNKILQTSVIPNYMQLYRMYGTNNRERVPNNNSHTSIHKDNYLSAYISGMYRYRDQYNFSASLRSDAANPVGENFKDKLLPFWSVGFGWDISQAKFYKSDKIPYLKFRATKGTSGNMYRSFFGAPTIQASGVNSINQPVAIITTLPNPNLRWERTCMTNLGFDVATKNNKIAVSADFYVKNSTHLFAKTKVDPGLGMADGLANSAAMKGRGFEVTITANDSIGKLAWSGILSINHATDKVTAYKGSQLTVGDYLKPGEPVPMEGHSLYSIYSVPSMGLNAKGQLIAVENGVPGYNYANILASANIEKNLIRNGSSIPVYFGSFVNRFTWKSVCLSININYKLGYYFRRTSVNYNNLFQHGIGHIDYTQRWQQAGDEKITSVPALEYPANQSAITYYTFSKQLVEPADHIRLQQINLSYFPNLNTLKIKWLPFKTLCIDAGVTNIGILWRSNHFGIDPDNKYGFPSSPTYIIGIKTTF